MSARMERFWAKVDKTEGCWLWVGAKSPNGYGSFWIGGDKGSGSAHRFAYQALVGPVSRGLVLDHLCRVRHCVNPDHLEPVTELENIRRGESPSAHYLRTGRCRRDHAYTPENTYITPTGARECRACRAIWVARRPKSVRVHESA